MAEEALQRPDWSDGQPVQNTAPAPLERDTLGRPVRQDWTPVPSTVTQDPTAPPGQQVTLVDGQPLAEPMIDPAELAVAGEAVQTILPSLMGDPSSVDSLLAAAEQVETAIAPEQWDALDSAFEGLSTEAQVAVIDELSKGSAADIDARVDRLMDSLDEAGQEEVLEFVASLSDDVHSAVIDMLSGEAE